MGAPSAPPGGPGIEPGTEDGGPCCGGPPEKIIDNIQRL